MDFEPSSKENRSKFIEESKDFIHRTACDFCSRQLLWDSDEINVSLIAFNRACEYEKGMNCNLLGYAAALIKHSLFQYYIKSDKTPFFIFYDENKAYSEYLNTLSEFETYFEEHARMIELTLLQSELNTFGIHIEDIYNKKYSDINEKNQILNASVKFIQNENILENNLSKAMFKPKYISDKTNCDISLLSKWQKYFIFLTVTLSSDKYIYLQQFLNIRVGDDNAEIGNNNQCLQ